MNAISLLFGLLAAATAAYMIVCIFAVMLSWFPSRQAGNLGEYARRLSAPFFALFRSKRGPTQGGIDLSPLVGFVILSVLFSLFSGMSSYGSISFALFLLTLLASASMALATIIVFLAILAIIRLGFLLAKPRFSHPALSMAGKVVEPLVLLASRLSGRDRIMPYKQSLIIAIVGLVASRVLLALLVDFLGSLIVKIPF